MFLVWTGFNAAWNFISLRIADQGGGAFLVGLGTALGGVLEVFTMRASSGLQGRWGLRKVYLLGCFTNERPLDVGDPVYSPRPVFEACFERIDRSVQRLIGMVPSPSPAPTRERE